jgi:hypothetical protein
MSVANFTTIIELKITHGRDGTEWFIVNPSNPNQSYGYFESLTIEEGILNVIPSGTLVLRDEGDLISDFNFTGKDKFYLKIKDSSDNEIELSDYYVYQVARATDYQKRNDPRFVTIKFIHESFFFNERSVFEFEEDIKPISKKGKEDSWVGQIFAKYFPEDWERDTAYASDTKNYAWLKHKNLVYPNGRKADQTKILNLLNYFAENANVDNDPPRADFFFWKDLTGVNFLSLGDEIAASEKAEGIYGVYDRDSIAPDGIVKIDDISVFNFSFMDLETSGAFQSYYERVDPNLDQPHFYLMDSTNSLKTKIINFNFLDYYPDFVDYLDKSTSNTSWDIDQSSDIAKYEIINFGGQEIDISISQGTKLTKHTKRIYDQEKFGYFDHSYNNSNYNEPTYFYNTDGGVTYNNFSSHRRTAKIWQNMFDIDEESPIDEDDTSKNIARSYIQLKKQKAQAAEIYFKLRNLKERWNIFKYVICCINIGERATSFWALLTYALPLRDQLDTTQAAVYDKINAFRYSFKPIYFSPKNTIEGFTHNFKSVLPDLNVSTHPSFGITYAPGPGSEYAYNLNEIMNFADVNLNVRYSGPGTNVNSQGYPQNFVNIPIGGYQNSTSTQANVEYRGHVVLMHGIKASSIPGLSFIGNPELVNRDRYFYFFDAQNDKEGVCDLINPVTLIDNTAANACDPPTPPPVSPCCYYSEPPISGNEQCPDSVCRAIVYDYYAQCASVWDEDCAYIAANFCDIQC